MHKLLLPLSMLLASSAAMAGLVKIENNDMFSTGESYTDPAFNKKEGSIVTFTIIKEYDRPLGFSKGMALSHISKSAYDCEKKRVKYIVDTHMDGHMGTGKAVQSYEQTDEWFDVNEGTRGEWSWKAACGKR